MSHQEASFKSVLFALLANLGIAITKTIAAVITKSGSMLAESIHSYADCGNQGLLFLGLKKSDKKPDIKHPLGYGKEIYFWSFIVALILFSLGGCFSIYEGIHKLNSPEPIYNAIIAIIILSVSLVLEAASLYGCIMQIKKIKGECSLLKWIVKSRNSEIVVVFAEDVAALLGLVIALISIILTDVTGNSLFDALGSICIGFILICVSVFLAVKIKGLLVGQSVDEYTQIQIDNFLKSRPEIKVVLNVITLQLGSQVMVAVKAKMAENISVPQLIDGINSCEAELKKLLPSVKWVFFEPDKVD